VKPDAAIVAFHILYNGVFLVRVIPAAGATPAPASPSSGESVRADARQEARFSRSLVFLHTLAFFAMYWGLGHGVFSGAEIRELFPYQRVVGGAVLLLAVALALSALLAFRSWRIRAAIEPGHELATGGPFALVRNPIYLSMDLLALGSVIWCPSVAGAIGFLLMCLFGDLRARAEERVLVRAFGAPYEAYRTRVKRYLPGVY
jgi:protein-S-isoprenylcysteine O-methyltransferase Ste14